MSRRVVTHKARTIDREMLQVVTIFEENVNKQQIRKLIPYCKTYQVLLNRGGFYEFVSKKA